MRSLHRSTRVINFAAVALLAACLIVTARTATAQSRAKLTGGAHGLVRNAGTGAPLEGMMIQLVSHKTAIRTTVYSNQVGRFEFPELPTGWYALRISRPLQFKPYQKDSVWIEGSPQLEEIALERMYPGEFLPPTPEIMAQLSDSEWLFNLPGTAYEKNCSPTPAGAAVIPGTNHCGTGLTKRAGR